MDHSDVALRSVARALADVVDPAVSPDAALAKEQLRLSVEYLTFAITRIEFLHERAVFELRHQLRLARAVRRAVGGSPAAAALDRPIAQGERLASVISPLGELRQASADLAAGVAAVLRGLETSGRELRRELIRLVATESRERVVFERSWYAPLGIDPDPDEVPDLAALLGSIR